MVEVDYRVDPERARDFYAVMMRMQRMRKRIGGFDVLMGNYRGAPLYMRTDDAHDWAGRKLLIGVTDGPPRGE